MPYSKEYYDLRDRRFILQQNAGRMDQMIHSETAKANPSLLKAYKKSLKKLEGQIKELNDKIKQEETITSVTPA